MSAEVDRPAQVSQGCAAWKRSTSGRATKSTADWRRREERGAGVEPRVSGRHPVVTTIAQHAFAPDLQ